VVHSDRPKHAYLSPMPHSRIRPRRGFAAGGNGVWGEESALYRAPGATLGRSTIYLIIIILFISFLRTLLLSPFVLVRLREGVYRLSEGGVNTRGHLDVRRGLQPCCTPVKSSAIHAFENIRVNIECSHLTWPTFQPCLWITVPMALQREAYWFSAVFLALAR
jgi:hypothetical protein